MTLAFLAGFSKAMGLHNQLFQDVLLTMLPYFQIEKLKHINDKKGKERSHNYQLALIMFHCHRLDLTTDLCKIVRKISAAASMSSTREIETVYLPFLALLGKQLFTASPFRVAAIQVSVWQGHKSLDHQET